MLMNVEKKQTRQALVQLFILLCLYTWAFLSEIKKAISSAASSSEMVYALLFPVLIACLIYLRRDSFTKCSFKGSVFGLVFTISGLIIYAVSTWPFSFGYARNMAMIPILAGITPVTRLILLEIELQLMRMD